MAVIHQAGVRCPRCGVELAEAGEAWAAELVLETVPTELVDETAPPDQYARRLEAVSAPPAGAQPCSRAA